MIGMLQARFIIVPSSLLAQDDTSLICTYLERALTLQQSTFQLTLIAMPKFPVV